MNRVRFNMPFISKLAHVITKESLIGCVGFDYKVTYSCTYKITKEFLDVLHDKYLDQIVNAENPLKEAYFLFFEENKAYQHRVKMRKIVFLYASNFDKMKFLKSGGLNKMINDELRGKKHVPEKGYEKLYEADLEEATSDVPYSADPLAGLSKKNLEILAAKQIFKNPS